ncbi:hypothetical protein [Methanococcoides seepicolus]|uniref:S-layer family duplication domain-containing protein n=1 Tax=Methanococcoides seepicolus TaxID=2828780 RepID=A0A9E4ZHF4_9EURY|nr:hypothetical protein [Methanococcoides seepicolus]MCM1987676.1 hypothetical protein [Methanococcoides seepicolus]
MQKIFVLTILLLLIAATNAHASFIPEAGMISYQINDSDRIAVGNVTNIQEHLKYSVVTINVDEWLMGPLPSNEIEVITERGSMYSNANEPRFYTGESVILMLQDINVADNRFKVTIGEPGKHPTADRDEIISELESMAKSNKSEIVSTTESDNTTPFIGSIGLVLVFACVGLVLRRSQK